MRQEPSPHSDTAEPAWRRASITDASTITDLVRAAYARWVPVIDREPLPMATDYAKIVDLHQIDVLEHGGSMLGIVEMVFEEGVLLIENVAVAAELQRGGLGATLVNHAEHVAADHQLPAVRLYTNARFLANIRFYERLGFTIVRREGMPNGVVVHMHKVLS